MNLLVTGGAGYIGSHFCKLASGVGHCPVVLDNLSTGHKEFVKFGPLVMSDIRNTSDLIEALKTHKIEAVVHFAAKSLVSESMKDPKGYFDNNVEGTRSLLEAMRVSGVKKIVFSSSASVYGQPKIQPISEDDPKFPINPYGESKLACEKEIAKAHEAWGLNVVILRYFNVIGQDPEGELWEKHNPETHIVPNIYRAWTEKNPFKVFGQDYKTPDGTCVRDYVDVNDLGMVHLDALNWLGATVQSGNHFMISNVGLGRGYSIKEVLGAFNKVFGALPPLEMAPRREGDPDTLISDVTRFRSWCGLQMKSLEESIGSLKLKVY